MKIHMIYLAAGNSRRFQDNKLLYNYQGQPLYRYGFNQLLKLLSNDNYTLDVVTQYPEIIFDIKQFNYPRLYVIKSPKSHLGIAYSIQAGIKKYNQEKDAYFLFLVADQPYIKASTIQRLIDETLLQKAILSTLAYQEKVGNPTLFHCQFYNELMSLKNDEGGRKIINRYQNACLKVKVEDVLELLDIDTKEDIEKRSSHY